MITTLLTFPYAKVEGEPAILLGWQEIGDVVKCLVCTLTDEKIRVVDLDKVRLDSSKMTDLRGRML